MQGEVLGDGEMMVQEREGEADCVTFLSFFFFLFPFPHCVCCADSRCSSSTASAQNQEHSWALNFTELDTYCNFPASQLLSAAHASLQMLTSKTVDLPTERKKTVLPNWAEGSPHPICYLWQGTNFFRVSCCPNTSTTAVSEHSKAEKSV